MSTKRKLVLTGLMGTGKSTVARLLAEHYQLPLIEIDELITTRVGSSIPDIFEQYGESGFRAWEATICAEIGQEAQAAIVSTGGGALLNPLNRYALEPDATIVCLSARPEVIHQRLQATNNRPLLAGDDPEARIRELLEKRNSQYGQFRWQVDTSDLSPLEVAQQVMAIWEQNQCENAYQRFVTTPTGGYRLCIGDGLFINIVDLLDAHDLLKRRTIVVTDTHVAPLYGRRLVNTLPDATLVVMQAGEQHKNHHTVTQFYTEFARMGLDRNGVVIALGGGVVGDAAGFAAASYMRGVRLVQVPTSMLAMVDSSVGGKVGVDIPQGKNLVGAFKNPDLVVIDPAVLRTLPKAEFAAGMAEVIKHGLLANPALLEADMSLLDRLTAAVDVKINIVERDPFEHGERAYLNLGHTFAHAIEQVSGYTWRHGEAVGVGLIGAALLSHRLGLIDPHLVNYIKQQVANVGLPTQYQQLAPRALWQAMHIDKKWKDGRSHFVVLRGLGKPDIVRDVPEDVVIQVLEELRG